MGVIYVTFGSLSGAVRLTTISWALALCSSVVIVLWPSWQVIMSRISQIPEGYSPTHLATADGLKAAWWQITVGIAALDAQMINYDLRV